LGCSESQSARLNIGLMHIATGQVARHICPLLPLTVTRPSADR
jgi:hypothetical protein